MMRLLGNREVWIGVGKFLFFWFLVGIKKYPQCGIADKEAIVFIKK